jgi:hypothetical protein
MAIDTRNKRLSMMRRLPVGDGLSDVGDRRQYMRMFRLFADAVQGPYSVLEATVYVPGQTRDHAYIPGSQRATEYVPGDTRREVVT